MKIICYLFSVYFLLLTGVTCADRVSYREGSGTEISTNKDLGHGAHGHEKTNDDCSPFCGCQCCHLNVFLKPVDLHFTRNFIPQLFTTYFRDIPETEVVDFFKPPKMDIY